MKGKYDEGVLHVPTGRRGVVARPNGSVGIMRTPVKFEDGRISEFPDVELKLDSENGSIHLLGVQFNRWRELPPGGKITIVNNGDGTVSLIGEAPGQPTVTIAGLQPMGGMVGLPALEIFPARF